MTELIEEVRELPENDPSAKFQILTTVPLPRYCVACRMGADGRNQFVDLTMDLDYYGAVLLCRNCAEEIARVVGFESTAIIADKLLNHSELIEKLADAELKVQVLENVVFTYGISSDPSSDEPAIDLETDPSEESGEHAPSNPKSGSSKQTSSK
jgi:hypothetical protein